MKTIKIIDLLNKKNNNEELPKKFKYDDEIFIYNNEKNDYIYEDGNISFFHDYCSPIDDFEDCLATFRKEAEIIEEEKEIEKIPYHYNFGYIDCGDLKIEVVEELSRNFNYFADKINELIAVVNKLRKEK